MFLKVEVSLLLQNLILKTLVVKKLKFQEEPSGPDSNIPVLLKIDQYFIPKGNIQSVLRYGRGCKIMLISGDELVVEMTYEKVVDLVG